MAITTIAPRSSMIASAVRKSLSEAGTRLPNNAMTPRENAMSVDQGIAQPDTAPGGSDPRAGCRPGRTRADAEVYQGRNDHPADCGCGGQGRPAPVGKLALEQL